MPPARRLECLGDAPDREIVGFGSAAREHDFGRLGLDQIGNRRARLVEDGFGPLPELVDARRVAEFVGEDAGDPVDDLGIDRGRSVVIEVNAHL